MDTTTKKEIKSFLHDILDNVSATNIAKAKRTMVENEQHPDTTELKGILTDYHTDKECDVVIEYEILDIDDRKIFQLINGVTGYESFYIDSEYNHLENVCDNGWTACAGTKGVWDKLFIPGDEMRKALAPFMEKM
jgi:hypothetical protein